MVWYSFVTVAGWSQHNSPRTASSASRSYGGHIRSLSSFAARPARPHGAPGHQKSPSLSHVSVMSAEDTKPAGTGSTSPTPSRSPRLTPGTLSSQTFDDDNDLSTLPDPRSRAMSPASGHGFATGAHHPDLDEEVATLSTKLINAINHQTSLDDTLSSYKMELEEARETIRRLESRLAEQREMLAGDVWVRRKTVEADKARLLDRVAEEKKARQDMEGQKKKIEQELENLTTALFEEANKMVISAKEESRREQEVVQRKNDLLRSQLADTEGLLRSQQDQLAELKLLMEQMSTDRDDQTALTAPSSPGFSKFDSKDETSLSESASQAGLLEPISPSYPTSFTHLLQPILRTDLSSYEDFTALVRTARRLSVRSRPPSGSHSGAMSALGLTLGHSVTPSNGSNTSISTAGTPASGAGSLPQTPNTPASTLSAGSAGTVANLPPLKDTKFYKRVLSEDIEPTLRLDIAPGLSWLARRAVINAMTDGSLVVEPIPHATPGSITAIARPQFFPCALCGEARRDEEHLRTHRFRTSESESAQRYPLCRSYCLVRVRAACDFLAFLRLLKDGHWRADDEDAEKAAWEESVRLREQMFWARIGGGVVPAAPMTTTTHATAAGGGNGGAHHHQQHASGSSGAALARSPRASQEGARSDEETLHQGADDKNDASDKTTTPETDETVCALDEESSAAPAAAAAATSEPPLAPTTDKFLPGTSPDRNSRPLTPPPTNRASTPPLGGATPSPVLSPGSGSGSPRSEKDEVKRLSLQIPGQQQQQQQ